MDQQQLDRLQKMVDEARSKDGIEHRIYAADTMRMERRDDKDSPVMVGHAAVFDQDTDIGGYFHERVAPGAFARAIREDDVRSLFNHDPNFILGRNRARPTPTLRLREDGTGLYTETDLPDTSYGRDLEVSLERGDISQMSFAFRVKAEKWEEQADKWLRTILEVLLYDISPVTFPAYPTTDVGLRSLQAYRKLYEPRGLTTVNAAAIVRNKLQKLRDRGEGTKL